LETVELKLFRPLLQLTRLESQRNHEVHNRLKVNSLIEYIKTASKELVRQPGKNGQSRPAKLAFHYQSRGRRNVGTPREKGKTKNTLSFKRTGFNT
jgi:hypothetical protein